tara:strand:+ start:2544 stop:2726 length:183 start_codon:yes stop_codon:yes gene_type:complete
MKRSYFNLFSKLAIYFSLFAVIFPQRLDSPNSAYDDLRTIVETASRSQQRIWVEDFTGLN